MACAFLLLLYNFEPSVYNVFIPVKNIRRWFYLFLVKKYLVLTICGSTPPHCNIINLIINLYNKRFFCIVVTDWALAFSILAYVNKHKGLLGLST